MLGRTRSVTNVCTPNTLYFCDMCDYKTRNKSHFTRHRMRHTGERPYKCAICNKGFITGHHLRYHVASNHTEYS